MDILRNVSRNPLGLTVPALTILIAVFGIPTIFFFFASLNAPEYSLSNYEAFLSRGANVRILFQTIEISVIATLLCLAIGYPTAYLITAAPKRARVALTVLVFLPWLTSGLVRTYAWIVLLGDNGLINRTLIDLGLISSPLPLIYNRLAVYIGMVHIMLPVMILPLLSVMQGIDKSLVAAARSMGARPFTAFWRVFLPLSLPGVRSGTVLVFVICLGFYITPQALGGLRDVMLSTFIANQIETSFSIGVIAAAAFMLLAIAAIVLSVLGLDMSGERVRPDRFHEEHWARRVFRSSIVTRGMKAVADKFRAARWTRQLYQRTGAGNSSALAGSVFLALVMTFLLLPGMLDVVMSFSGGAYLEFPPSTLSLQWYRSFLGDPSWTGALWTSVQVGLIVAALSTIVGTLAAYGLSRTTPRIRSSFTMCLMAPITFPAIVVGVAIYFGMAKIGLVGTVSGIVLTQSVGATAYAVVIVSATLATFDRRLERAALSMQASPIQTLVRVTMPLIRPGIIGGALFAFIHSFDEVVQTSLVSGFAIRTLPLKMWENMRNELDPTIAAIGSLLTLLPILWLVALYVTWWRVRPKVQAMAQ
ncbi:ABC transporter permease [Bradyrhizobium sacchari]|uniref:Putative spermidine/putrescine transport system permease protein n=1 Tax=Bradyrhizobium sacchari TaxID=1399419 RepID=A0A560JE14_9BRAD|nr:ABC transporter permease subunit [Bradyrhizobium sacchari]OPY96648.1 ABC transporter permease [Bradyrhizobium sacchari]TWB51204.1 putative spermidine/putrescine transport system permease protein [Bradyrhizobium sacchari]TWB69438.1 putative spermidine/putrescine transport system permease protein [Bradyrhizobium sacchari]